MDELERIVNAATIDQWRETMRSGYVRAFVLFALHETGVLDRLRDLGEAGATTSELARWCSIDERALGHILAYLELADVVIERAQDRWRLTERGDWIFRPLTLHLLYHSVGAYSSVLFDLAPMLRGEKRYGKDFVRRDDYVAIGTQGLSHDCHRVLADDIARLQVRSVAELGCGSAHVLVRLCASSAELRGVGIDISADALDLARTKVADAGLAGRIQLIRADVGDPAAYADGAADVDLFVCIGVLHEFLRDGDDGPVRVLAAMRQQFPGRYLVVAEHDRQTPDELRSLPIEVRLRSLLYQELWHPLSNQGLQTRAGWQQIFERAGVELVSLHRLNIDMFLLRL